MLMLVPLLAIVAVGPGAVDPCESLAVPSARAGLVAVRESAAMHSPLPGAALTLCYEGTVSIEDHLMRPGMVRTVQIAYEFVHSPGERVLRVRETAKGRTSTTLIDGDRVVVQAEAGSPFVEKGAGEAGRERADAFGWTPSLVAHAAIAAAPSCRLGASIADRSVTLVPVSFVDGAGRAASVFLDPSRHIRRLERLESHQRLGDVCHWTSFDDWVVEHDIQVPRKLARFEVRPASTLRFDLALVRAEIGAPPSVALPVEHVGDVPGWGAPSAPAEGLEFVQLAENLWSIEVAAADVRVLVVEGEGELFLMGAPDGDEVCGGLVDALAARFPGKRLARAAFGHHHPSPSGGLRALAAAGATIIAPRALEEYVRSLLTRPTTLGPPGVAAPPEPGLEFFEGELTINCGTTVVRLIDIGEQSAHAFCYTVFYLPQSGVLFEDDLGYFPSDRVARIGPRLRGLVDALESRAVVPSRLVQLWPVRGVHREVAWSTVLELAHAANERDARSATPVPAK